MILVNTIGDNINVSCKGKEYNVLYTEDKFTSLMTIADASTEVETMEELNELLEKVDALCKNDYKERVEAFHPEIYMSPVSNQFYLKLDNVVSSVAMPQVLVDRLETSIEKGIDISPVIKAWKRCLRNPKMIGGSSSVKALFSERFAEYIEMVYVNPMIVEEEMEKGLNEENARKIARIYEVKITQEGLLACFKLSTEIETKFVADDEGNPKQVSRFSKTFDADTGEITGDDRDDMVAEDRVFQPYMMGDRGDAFFCEGLNGTGKEGHIIKIGCVHRLADWSMVNTNDHRGCVEGLHLGGLSYISDWEGGRKEGLDIHTCLVDPMHIGAIPEYCSSLAIRVLQYYVDGSLTALNHGIYHGSKYAAKTDLQWAEMSKAILEDHGVLVEELSDSATEIDQL